MVYFLCKVYDSDRQNCYFAQSLPVRGAWIEIASMGRVAGSTLSLPVRGAWIEILRYWLAHDVTHASLPVRGAWIEILDCEKFSPSPPIVAPRAGSVD